MLWRRIPVIVFTIMGARVCAGQDRPVTTLLDDAARFPRPSIACLMLKRGDVEAVVVDNSPVDDDVLPGHRGGYSGVGSLKHARRRENLFVPAYAGLNFEHCHDGTMQAREVLFEPRHAPMELRRIDEHTVDLYQTETPHYRVESCIRYAMLPDGAIEMTVECVPRGKTWKHGYLNLFFASYIHRPESPDVHFFGFDENDPAGATPKWIRGVTPTHGVLSTHRARGDDRVFAHDDEFSLSLVFNYSRHRYAEPWYYGVSHGMALVFMFRARDDVRLTQSPSGGGEGNPAWDFQWFIEQPEVGRVYRFVMRAMYVPFESQEQIVQVSAVHRHALNAPASSAPAPPPPAH